MADFRVSPRCGEHERNRRFRLFESRRRRPDGNFDRHRILRSHARSIGQTRPGGLDASRRRRSGVDEHHTVEDAGLSLGAAMAEALGDKRGIERYGFLLPMDESLAEAAIDLSGRPCLVFRAVFHRERVGELPVELVSHFFESFARPAMRPAFDRPTRAQRSSQDRGPIQGDGPLPSAGFSQLSARTRHSIEQRRAMIGILPTMRAITKASPAQCAGWASSRGLSKPARRSTPWTV